MKQFFKNTFDEVIDEKKCECRNNVLNLLTFNIVNLENSTLYQYWHGNVQFENVFNHQIFNKLFTISIIESKSVVEFIK